MAYYVTLQHRGSKGSQFVAVAGPFRRHGDALAMRGPATTAAYRADPRTAWDAFGTTHALARHDHRGVLNERLGLTLDDSGFVVITDPPRRSVDRGTFLHGSGPAPRGFVRCCDPDCHDDEVLPHFHPLTTEPATA